MRPRPPGHEAVLCVHYRRPIRGAGRTDTAECSSVLPLLLFLPTGPKAEQEWKSNKEVPHFSAADPKLFGAWTKQRAA